MRSLTWIFPLLCLNLILLLFLEKEEEFPWDLAVQTRLDLSSLPGNCSLFLNSLQDKREVCNQLGNGTQGVGLGIYFLVFQLPVGKRGKSILDFSGITAQLWDLGVLSSIFFLGDFYPQLFSTLSLISFFFGGFR